MGTAVLLAEQRAPELLGRQDLSIVLEEEVGIVQCIVRRPKGRTRASFTLPRLPAPSGETLPSAMLAGALSIDESELGFDDHAPVTMSAGVSYALVPLRTIEAVDRAWPDMGRWPDDLAAFLYARGGSPGAFHARMFAPSIGIPEDPATGSAVAAFAGVLARAERLADGDHTITVWQGVAMGRPSLITLGLEVQAGALVSASIGGDAVVVSQGTLDL